MDQGKKSVFEKGLSPVYQALLTFGGVVVVNIGGLLVRATGIMDITIRFPWMTAAAFMLVLAVPLTDEIGFAASALFILWHLWRSRKRTAS